MFDNITKFGKALSRLPKSGAMVMEMHKFEIYKQVELINKALKKKQTEENRELLESYKAALKELERYAGERKHLKKYMKATKKVSKFLRKNELNILMGYTVPESFEGAIK